MPLPPGVPYEEQQVAWLAERRGWLDLDAAERADLAGALAAALPE